MSERVPLAALGAALAEPVRLRILQELLGGTPLPAGVLAARVGIAPSTASSHLARLVDAGLIRVSQSGRSRLALIASTEVAEAVEALLRLSGEPAVSSLSEDTRRIALRRARSCYDHLAGSLGVALTDLAVERGWVVDTDGSWTMPAVRPFEAGLGLRIRLAETARPAVRACMDWTERRPHLAGRLGAAVLDTMLDANWVRRRRDDRSLTVTPAGRTYLAQVGIDV